MFRNFSLLLLLTAASYALPIPRPIPPRATSSQPGPHASCGSLRDVVSRPYHSREIYHAAVRKLKAESGGLLDLEEWEPIVALWGLTDAEARCEHDRRLLFPGPFRLWGVWMAARAGWDAADCKRHVQLQTTEWLSIWQEDREKRGLTGGFEEVILAEIERRERRKQEREERLARGDGEL
ncbi:hypothetical protein QBC46DRAFT_341880 [Diplogelasinospora grovesii]|uniref:Uncharacterized protein n=1 Tax=Diplogelasinospora grovesii TaxID=303347 RepID=A0AAN6N831_9PEZI|nr:hypothetical protein QBC46DRAFT_341880 [Diplogelasinospora grovesii]